MFEPGSRPDQDGRPSDTPSTGHLDELLAGLASPDGAERLRARDRIVALGAAAVPGLIGRLQHGAFRLRWEAAKALGAIGDPAATDALLEALCDRDQDVRWLAAEALTAIGRPAAVPVIRLLEEHSASGCVRQGVHHVLHGYGDPQLREQTAALVAVLGRTADDADVIHVAAETLTRLGAGHTVRDGPGPGTRNQGE